MLLVSPVNAGSTVADAPLRIGFTLEENASAWLPMAAADETNVLGEDCARSAFTAARRAVVACAVPPNPCSAKVPDTGMESGDVASPVAYSTVPSSDVITGKPLAAFSAATWSATRPPHPLADCPSETALCHCACWSE